MPTVQELVVQWGFDVDDKDIKKLDDSIGGMKSTVLSLVASIAASGAGLFGLSKFGAQYAETIQKIEARTGIAAEQIQRFAYAANQADLGIEEITQSLGLLGRTIQNAKDGSKEASEALSKLGPVAQGLIKSGAPLDQLMAAIADRFQGMTDPVERSALAMKLFGRSGGQLVPMLSKGSAELNKFMSEADGLRLVLNAEQLDNLSGFEEGFKRLLGGLKGIALQVAARIVPAMNALLDRWSKFIALNGEKAIERIGAVMDGLFSAFNMFLDVFEEIFDQFIRFTDLMGGLGRVVKWIGFMMSAFFGAQFLMSIGKGVQGLYAFAVAWRSVGSAAMLANLKMMAIPIAIGAAIVAVLLLIEDVVAAFQGKESFLVGVMQVFMQAFTQFSLWLGGIISNLATKFGDMMYNLFVKPITDIMNRIMPMINSMMGFVTGGIGKVLGFAGITPATAPTQSQASNQSNVSAETTINVNAGGLPPDQAVKAIENGVSGGFAQTLREAGRTFQPTVVQ